MFLFFVLSLRLVLLELRESPVFEGPPGRLLLTYDLTALEDRKYYEAGVLIGWSLAHGSPGPRCLHPALYQVVYMGLFLYEAEVFPNYIIDKSK